MFTESASIYDAIYASFHDFAAEAARLVSLVTPQLSSDQPTLLDVACGTGAYLVHLRQHFAVQGLDLDPTMLEIAAEKLPDVPFHQGDLADFDLGHEFDAVVCLGSSIGYAKTLPRLRQSLQTFARHAVPGGIVVVEPWFTPEVWEAGRVQTIVVEQPTLKIARMSLSAIENQVSIMDFHYLVGDGTSITHINERHEMGLFSHDEYLDAFRQANLTVTYDAEGLIGRGLYLGIKGNTTD